MKRILALIMCIFSIILCISGCTVKEEIEIAYDQSFSINQEKLTQYTDLKWDSSDSSVVSVKDGTITGKAPGSAVITAKSGDVLAGEYTVTVVTIPISSIVLSTNNLELTSGDIHKLSFTLFPDDASKYGLSWKSADTSVATVNQFGIVTANSAGQTNISISTKNGIVSTCSVLVKDKPAYERLSDKERQFLDIFIENIGQFKNPDSVIIRGIQGSGTWYTVEVSAQNGFGGNNFSVYYLSPSLGFFSYEMYDFDQEIEISPDSSYNLDLLNEALKDKL